MFSYNLSPNEIEELYRGEENTVSTLSEAADKVFATEFIDAKSIHREENERVEVYDMKAMVVFSAVLSSRCKTLQNGIRKVQYSIPETSRRFASEQ